MWNFCCIKPQKSPQKNREVHPWHVQHFLCLTFYRCENHCHAPVKWWWWIHAWSLSLLLITLMVQGYFHQENCEGKIFVARWKLEKWKTAMWNMHSMAKQSSSSPVSDLLSYGRQGAGDLCRFQSSRSRSWTSFRFLEDLGRPSLNRRGGLQQTISHLQCSL